MSFDNNYNIPSLVDKKIINYYKNKIKQNTLSKNNIQEDLIQPDSNTSKIYNNLLTNAKCIITNYYGFLLLFFSITVLLYLRYKDVNKRKKYINKIKKIYKDF